jgi:hypothetical protein
MELKANKKDINNLIKIIDKYLKDKKNVNLKSLSKKELYRLRMQVYEQIMKEYKIHKCPKSGIMVLEVK